MNNNQNEYHLSIIIIVSEWTIIRGNSTDSYFRLGNKRTQARGKFIYFRSTSWSHYGIWRSLLINKDRNMEEFTMRYLVQRRKRSLCWSCREVRKAFDHLNTDSWLAWIPSHKSYGNSPFCHPHLPTPKQSWTSFLFFWEGGEVGFETLTADCRNQSLVGSPGYRGYVRIVNFRGLYKFDKGSFPFEHATFVHAVSRHILIGR